MKRQLIVRGWRAPVLFAGLICAAVGIFWISGGVPPATWKLLLRTVPQIPSLWKQRGTALLLPLAILVLQSLALGAAWILFLREMLSLCRSVFTSASPAPQVPEIWSPLSDLQAADSLQRRPTPVALSSPAEPSLLLTPAPATGAQREPALARPLQSQTKRDEVDTGAREAVYSSARLQQEEGRVAETPLWRDPVASSEVPPVSQPPLVAGGSSASLPVGFAPHTSTALQREAALKQGYPVVVRGIRATSPPQSYGLFLLGDVTGGYGSSQIASGLTARSVLGVVEPLLETPQASAEELRRALVKGVHAANEALYQYNQDRGAFLESTITGGLVVGDRAFIVNVGDCRTYRYRPSEGLRKLTNDHSEVAQKVGEGELPPDALYTHPRRGVLLRSLGEKPEVDIDVFEIALQEHDRLLFCSHGFWEAVRDPDIQPLVAQSEATDASLMEVADACVQEALKGGGESLSVIVVYVVACVVSAPLA